MDSPETNKIKENSMNVNSSDYMFWDPVAQMIGMELPGGMILPISQQTVGNIYYLDPINGNDTNDGRSRASAFATLAVAYAALTDNNNDVLYYIATLNGQLQLPAAFVWAKNFTHFIGLCTPVPNARARIYQLATATGVTRLFTISGSGCMFKNLQIFQGVNDATSKIAVSISGLRNYFENCHFAGIGNVTQDVVGAASLELNGAQECAFKNCFIGLDTVSRSGNGATINSEILVNASAASSIRNTFTDCHIYAYIGNVARPLVYIGGTTSIDRFLLFKNCTFETDSLNQATTLTSAFKFAGAMVQGKIILKDCMLVADGATAWDSVGEGILFVNMQTPTAAAAGGIYTKK